ncbi:hypothetical protein [Gordonia sp. VNK21]|uniref:hypothetical protein n=1 Tax=Gordonia sp. VNK21 TaxID=3382483 RepID=UPI0038D44D93
MTQPHEPIGASTGSVDQAETAARSVRRWQTITSVAVGAAALTVLGFFLVGQDGRGSSTAPATITQTSVRTTQVSGEPVTETRTATETVTNDRTATEHETAERTRTVTETDTVTRTDEVTTTVTETVTGDSGGGTGE